MSITLEQVTKVAELARLESRPHDAMELSNILKLVEEMQEVNTDHVTPMAHPLDIAQPLRSDVITETDQRGLLQQIAPAVEAGLYLVPEVIEQREKT